MVKAREKIEMSIDKITIETGESVELPGKGQKTV